jgi:hypothetical protein
LPPAFLRHLLAYYFREPQRYQTDTVAVGEYQVQLRDEWGVRIHF